MEEEGNLKKLVRRRVAEVSITARELMSFMGSIRQKGKGKKEKIFFLSKRSRERRLKKPTLFSNKEKMTPKEWKIRSLGLVSSKFSIGKCCKHMFSLAEL